MSTSISRTLAKASLPIILMSDATSIVRKKSLGSMDRIGKTFIFLGLVHLVTKLKMTRPIALFTGTSISLFITRALTWQMSLYVLLRLVFQRFRSNEIISWLLSTKGVFLSNVIHNYLLTHRAETIDPSYIRLWLTTLPAYQRKGVTGWLNEFSSSATSTVNYRNEQVSDSRLKKLPHNLYESFASQFPYVTLVYAIAFVVSIRNIWKKGKVAKVLMKQIADLILKVFRTSVVLSLLPYCLTEFPAFYGHYILPLTGTAPVKDLAGGMEVKRNPLLHTLLPSVFSTAVFLQEPKGRLNMMVVYTWWKICEALVRDGLSKTGKLDLESDSEAKVKKQNGESNEEALLSATFMGSAAVVCSL